MAEITGLRNVALPYPVYGAPYGLVFPLHATDGTVKSGAGSLDSEKSLNGDTFADCTNEATEIGSSGHYYLLLPAAEMTADVVAVQVKSSDAMTRTITLFPRKLVTLSSGTCQGSNDTGDIQLASGDSAIDDYYNGCLVVAVIDGTTEARIINDYVGSTKVAEVSPAWNTAQPDSNDTYTIYLPEGRQFVLGDTRAFGGTAGTFSGGRPEVNASHAGGTAWGSGAITAGAIAEDAGTELATALLDLADGVESGVTLRKALRAMAAALAGKRSSSGTTAEQYDAVGNPGTARIVTNADANGDGNPTLSLT